MVLMGEGRQGAWETLISFQGFWRGQATVESTLLCPVTPGVGQGLGGGGAVVPRGGEGARLRNIWLSMGVGMALEHQATVGAPAICWPWAQIGKRDGVFADRPHTPPWCALQIVPTPH